MGAWEDSAKVIIKKLQDNGYEAYMVGGVVRDMLLGRPIRDIDICTNASIIEMQKIFQRTINVGASHGTLIVPSGEHAFELSEFKSVKDAPRSLHTDLSLRDFTCNAMALDSTGRIIDPFNGQGDLREKLVKVIGGEPFSLMEDPLRLLRGVRFALTLQFTIEEQTAIWMEKYAPLIKQPAVERVATELGKIFSHGMDIKQLIYLLEHPVIQELPLIFPARKMFYRKIPLSKTNITWLGELEGWSLLAFSDNMDDSKGVLLHYKLANKLRQDVLLIIEQVHRIIGNGWSNKNLYVLGERRIPTTEKLLAFLEDREVKVKPLLLKYKRLPITSKKQLAVNGHDIVQWFPKKSGHWIGECLNSVESAVLMNKTANTKRDIYKWLMKEYGE